ncbi:MAG: ATP-binding protein [Novosphingobium sp.]
MAATQCFSARHLPEQPVSATMRGAIDAVGLFAEGNRLDPVTAGRLAVIVDELIGNVLRHGGRHQGIALDLTISAAAGGVEVFVEDDGTPFDPRTAGSFAGPDEESGGGVGLALVHAWAEILAYDRRDGRNRLHLRLRGSN